MIAQSSRFFVVIMTYLSLFALGLVDNFRGALFPEILDHFRVSNSQGSWFFITTSACSVLGGYFCHQLNHKHSLFSLWKSGVLFMAGGALAIYRAPTFFWLLNGCAILGFGFGILAVTQNLLITKVSPPNIAKKLLSGLHSMYGLSSFLAPLLVAYFTVKLWPWNSLFFVAGTVALLIFLIAFRAGDPTVLPVLSSGDSNTVSSAPAKTTTNPEAFWSRRVLFFVMMTAAYVAMELLISTRLTTYLTRFFAWPLEKASLSLTWFFACLLFGRLVFSFFHFPISTRKTLLLSLVGSLFCLILGLHQNPWFLSVSGLFMAPFYPLTMAYLGELFPNKVNRLVSVTISLQSAFVIIMNLAVGQFTDLFGINAALHVGLGFGFLSWLLLMLL